ncbi:protein associated with UVRAG as autophagy enhancer [Eleutherodactylus coqui]|uniref:protein associated with UVRAG as autophagy enhancer n=1 Tax=Eleutherodactylus coqui TaxID=57060 RepID=UPI00346231D7
MAAQVGNDDKLNADLKPSGVPSPPPSTMPKISTVLFPEDKLPRPAVIDVVSSYASSTDIATEIKEILSSVLNLPSRIKSTLSVNKHLQDRDLANGEDSYTTDDDESDGDHDSIPLMATAQHDIRFRRHTAAWDNSEMDSPVGSLAPLESSLDGPELESLHYLRCNDCHGIILPGSEFVSPLNLQVKLAKENRRFSTPSIGPYGFIPTRHNLNLEQFTFHLNEAAGDGEASTGEKSFHRRSASFSNIFKEMEEFEQETAKKESDHPTERTEPLVSNTAEQTAMNLYRAFRKQWTGVAKDEQLAARATIDALSCKHTVPEELETSVSLEEEIKLVKIRDAEDWSPLQFQIITTEHPYVKRDEAVALQKYRCPGCGTKIEPKYTSRLRYCDYLGKYFCNCCHYLTGSPIPGRIFTSWNFGKYCVSNFSKNLVDIIWGSRLFNLLSVSPTLYKKVKDLQRVKEVQQQLIHIRKLIMTCRFSHEVVKAFEKIPSHLTRELHLFTLEDLFQVRQRTLLADLRELLALAVFHVGECQLCQAKGFFCEFCQHSKVIFPFQIEIVRRCEDCKACYHKECFKTGDCPKCLRIKARQARMSDSLFTSSEEVDPSPTA